MTGKRRVGRQDLKAVRLLAVLLVTLALMLQMDGQMDAAYAGQQMPGSSPVLEEEMLYITRKLDAGPELAGAREAVGPAGGTGGGNCPFYNTDAADAEDSGGVGWRRTALQKKNNKTG